MAFVLRSLPLRAPSRPPRTCTAQPIMNGHSELRRRLASVNTAGKLIDAMRLVAAARIRSTSHAALRTRPFANKLQGMLCALVSTILDDGLDVRAVAEDALPDAYHVFPDAHDHAGLLDRLDSTISDEQDVCSIVALVVVTGDKGFCGQYNRNVIQVALSRARALRKEGMAVHFVCVGKVATSFFSRREGCLVRAAIPMARPDASAGIASRLCDMLMASFVAAEIDRIEIVYTRFMSLLSNAPSVRTLVPITPSGIESLGDEIFELTSCNGHFTTRAVPPEETCHIPRLRFKPQEATLLLNAMLPMYVNSQLVRIVREAVASEHASRMSAMSVANDNAKSIANSLKLKFNRERQAKITKEIIELTSNQPTSY